MSSSDVPATNESVRAKFTKWAPWYDATHSMFLPRGRAIKALGLVSGEHVLDLACGTGLSFNKLQAGVGPAGKVVGVDLTPAMLNVARDRIQRHAWSNVDVKVADAAALPFPGASFDKALCCFALSIIPDYQGAIKEAYRVLKPGGRFVVLDVHASEGGVGWRLAHKFPAIPHICSVDVGHRSLEGLRAVFADVRVEFLMAKSLMVAVAQR